MPRYHSFICDSTRWEGFELRPGDVVVTTPPKAGTTWMQHCCLHLVHGGRPPAPLTEIAPWLDQSLEPVEQVHARLAAQQHQRVIKTHTPMDGLPWSDDVVYVGVGRDPRDVVLSMMDHAANFDRDRAAALRSAAGASEDPPPPIASDSVRTWLEEDSPPTRFGSTLRFTLHHLSTLWEARHHPNVHLFHYADMKRDLPVQLRRLAAAIGRPDADVDALTPHLTIEAMRARAEETAPNAASGVFRSPAQFFAQGRSGAWRDALPQEELDIYERRLVELCPDPKLRAWLHTTA